MSDLPNPLTGLTTEQELGSLQPIIDWRRQNLLGLENSLSSASERSMTSREGMARAAMDLKLEHPFLQGFGGPGIFSGPRAVNSTTQAMRTAMRMENAGSSEKEIQHVTGWFRGADDKWRQTISDEGAKLGRAVFPSTIFEKIHSLDRNLFPNPKLGDVLDHPDLYQAYPHLADIPISSVEVEDIISGMTGAYAPGPNRMWIAPGSEKNMLSTLLHETQHAVQGHEGFATGGSPRQFLPEGFEKEYGILNKDWNDFLSGARERGLNGYELEEGLSDILRGKDPHKRFFDNWNSLNPDQQYTAMDTMTKLLPMRETSRAARDNYLRLGGEVESRTVEEQLAQRDWSRLPQEYEGYIPREEQILRFGTPGVSQSIRGFHGTPYQFEPIEGNPFGEFRDSSIGSGEGAQAFGHGHYVAGNKAVAEDYQRGLAGSRPTFANDAGDPLNNLEVAKKFYEPGSIVPSYGGNFDKVLKFNEHPEGRWSVDVQGVVPAEGAQGYKNLGELLNNPDAWKTHQFERPRNHSTFPTDKNIEDIGTTRGYSMTKPGSLLEVHILPDEHELLDWDLPLSKQPEGVRQAIENFHASNEDLRILNSGPEVTGRNFYLNLANHLWDKTRAGIGGGSEAASKMLHEAGIPGIKYLDAGSRNAPVGMKYIGDLQPPQFARLIENANNHDEALSKLKLNLESQKLRVEDEEARYAGSDTHLIHPDSKSMNAEIARKHVNELESSIDFFNKYRDQYKYDDPRTSNYVVFHPSNLRIVGRNGQRLEPINEDPFK